MSSVKSGVSLPSQEKPEVDTKDDEGTKEKKMTTSTTGNTVKKENRVVEKTSSISEMKDAKPEKNVPSQGTTKTPSHDIMPSSTNVNVSTGGVTTAAATSKTNSSGTAVLSVMSSKAKPASTPTAMPAKTELAASGSTTPGMSKHTSDPKVDSSATTQAKKEKTENPVKKTIVTTTQAQAAVAPKQSQQHSHSKPHTQQQQQNRYFIPSRQNQEEAVFKMVQNVFKLLETRGPLTMAQLEYNLPILILGSSPSISMSSQTVNTTASKTAPTVSRDPPTGDSSKDGSNIVKKQNTDAKTSNNRTSLCEEKLIPGNTVPDIVELLVTLGLIQQQTNVDDTSSSGGTTLSVSSPAETDLSNTPQQQKQQALSAKNQLRKQPRFAVHFGKPKQFLVTPTNILSEISKAQTEVQLSRQRQELLKEALDMADQQAAERVKHIVLQHPQVVDDPVYVTALRNLQVDEMLMAGTSGASTAGNVNTSASLTIKDGSGKPKSGVGGSGKKFGGGKRHQSAGSTPAKRKRQRSKKDPLVRTNGDVDSSAGKKATAPSGSIAVGSKQTTGGSLPTTEGSKQVSSAKAVSVSNAPLSTQPVATVASASAIRSKNT